MDERDIENIKKELRLKTECLENQAKDILRLSGRIEQLEPEIERYKYIVDKLMENERQQERIFIEQKGYIKGIDMILNKLNLGLEVEHLYNE